MKVMRRCRFKRANSKLKVFKKYKMWKLRKLIVVSWLIKPLTKYKKFVIYMEGVNIPTAKENNKEAFIVDKTS